ncbi:alpha-1-4-glucan lyase [Dacryopinax primogenitus]|uniref:Alpha-1-4-glucan lyase n=1 Tax=Dacryopinax primogenitus (strain DJM 731) TaxID=1858805 RepID=M5G2E2_DACPD|nr:alpha-1-4-glucan lyase [Dacryopinax primogenitus]EJU04376.1 alpha-1-4-glucan lyase [Dacryopinax primogenitus]
MSPSSLVAGVSDPLNFVPAEHFFTRAAQYPHGPSSITNVHTSSSLKSEDPLRFAAGLEFDDGTVAIIHFASPSVWRVRYDPTFKTIADYSMDNSRSVMEKTWGALVDSIQRDLNTMWRTRFTPSEDGEYFTLATVTYLSVEDRDDDKNGTIDTKLYMWKSPFRLQVTRKLEVTPLIIPVPPDLHETNVPMEKVVWQTIARPFRYEPMKYRVNNIILHVWKKGSAEFLGFGEQGGKHLLKTPSQMNYYCYDNMLYGNLYNKGPLDDREPLYHSCPYFVEMNALPGYSNVTATFVDNYSQVVIDLGKSNAGRVSIGTRFNGFDAYIMSADNVAKLIESHTLLVGRPHLKPRYVLGNHQGCYGYRTREDLETVVAEYRAARIPLDGLHIDVDFQDRYRTFTWNEDKFPDVPGMFAELREKGVKCCTNITPVISLKDEGEGDDYPTLQEGLAKNYFIPDTRYLEGTSGKPEDVRYTYYWGNLDEQGLPVPQEVDPNLGSSTPVYEQNYSTFADNFNSGSPYHGGVSYGAELGTPGYYLDLNRPEVRDFWGQQYEKLFEAGLEFVWQDMTTPAIATGYGDMKGFPSRLWISTDPHFTEPGQPPPRKTAAELWALYSFNLHKATYLGLNKLECRENKRNFIVGRGSFSGMHRYAGLWTGDNASTWDFWHISVAQVLALGYIGVTIAGSDMGGFMPNGDEKFCDPDLLIRWYSGSVLLPWHRNHYIRRSGEKWFQEPYQYTNYLRDHPEIEADQGWLYSAVEPICRYYVSLRYSLMQLLYDKMFENQVNGLPIVRSMLITDPLDQTLFNEQDHFLDSQYVCGQDLLVCAVTESHTINIGKRHTYVPQPDNWYTFNLRIDGSLGLPLSPVVEGGSVFMYDCHISANPDHIPYVTPMYVREGGIIPQIEVRQYIGDKSPPNPITLHIYPGKNNTYSMYLDDGASRTSAPDMVPQEEFPEDNMARSEYREVLVSQTTLGTSRHITLTNVHDGYGPANVARDIGNTYTVVAWVDPCEPQLRTGTFTDRSGKEVTAGCSFKWDAAVKAGVATIPVELLGGMLTIVMKP